MRKIRTKGGGQKERGEERRKKQEKKVLKEDKEINRKKEKGEIGHISITDGSLQYAYFRNHNRMYDYAMISLLEP